MTYLNGWVTALDLDFSAQSNQTFTTDTTYTIAGLTWTKGNSANEATHASIINGTGLNFQPASATDYNAATRTLPYLWLPFTQVLPSGYDWDTKVRLWISVGTDNLTATYDNEVFGIDSNSTNFGWLYKRGYGTTSTGAAIFNQTNGTNNGFQGENYTFASFKTIMIQYESILASSLKTFRSAGISAGTPFPAVSSMQPSQILGFLNYSNNTFGTATVTPGGTGIILGAQRAGSGTSLSVNFQRVRLDFKL